MKREHALKEVIVKLSQQNRRFLTPIGRRKIAGAATFAAAILAAAPVYAQTSPWTQAVSTLQAAFTGPIATGLALVAIVCGGIMFSFGEGGAKRTLAGVIFGVGMAVGAVNFMSWLFP